MRNTSVTPEPRQKELIEEIQSYRDGVFYSDFTDVVDLQAKVAAATRQTERAPSSLTFAPLPRGVPVDWRWDWPAEQQGRADHAVLELHVLPVTLQPVPSRVLERCPSSSPPSCGRWEESGRRHPSPPAITPPPPGYT